MRLSATCATELLLAGDQDFAETAAGVEVGRGHPREAALKTLAGSSAVAFSARSRPKPATLGSASAASMASTTRKAAMRRTSSGISSGVSAASCSAESVSP